MSAYLVVGDNSDVREAVGAPLRAEGHAVTLVPMGTDAIGILRTGTIDTVIIVGGDVDVAANKLRGRILGEKLASRAFVVQPFVAKSGSLKTRRFAIGDHRLTEAELLSVLRSSNESNESTTSAVDKGVEALIQVIDVLVALEELASSSFRGSSHRSIMLARAVAQKMGLAHNEQMEIVIATLLKDIGKAGVPEALFEDIGRYSTDQKEQMQEHVHASVRLLEHIDFPWKVLPIVRHHHEHYDGTGYPDGLKGPEIPVGARILAAVDAYVAMLSNRPHRECMTASDARRELVSRAGSQFDPEIVEMLLLAIGQCAVSLSSAEKPVVLIADPDVEFIKLLAIRLVNEGLEVRAVSSAEEALLKILEKRPHIVLASCSSDSEAVLHLLEQLRQDASFRMLPILVMVDNNDRIVRTRALRAGADDVLTKRGDLQDIVVKVENVLAREAARGSADDEGPGQGITGRLESLALPDIFQILSLGLKTAKVSLEIDSKSGVIWFVDGSVVHAECGGKTGVEACYAMLRWKHGSFRIEHGLMTDASSIEVDTMMVVMEGLRLLDEEGAPVGDQPG